MIRYHSPCVGAVGPDHLDDVRVVDLAECADLPAHGVVAGGVVEQLEGPLFALDDVDDPVDLREAAAAEDLLDLEPTVDRVADARSRELDVFEDTSFGSGAGSTSPSAVSLSPARSSRLALHPQAVLDRLLAVDDRLGPVADAIATGRPCRTRRRR